MNNQLAVATAIYVAKKAANAIPDYTPTSVAETAKDLCEACGVAPKEQLFTVVLCTPRPLG